MLTNNNRNLLPESLVKYLIEKQNINPYAIDLPEPILQELCAFPKLAIDLMQAGLKFFPLCDYMDALHERKTYKGKTIFIAAAMTDEAIIYDGIVCYVKPEFLQRSKSSLITDILQTISKYKFDKLNFTHLTEYKYIFMARRFLVDLKVPVDTINKLTSDDWQKLHETRVRFNTSLNEFFEKCTGLQNKFKFQFSDIIGIFKHESNSFEDIIYHYYEINSVVDETDYDRTERWNIFFKWLQSGLNVSSILSLNHTAGILLADHPIYIDCSPTPISKAVEILLQQLSENKLTLKGMNCLSDAGKKLIFDNISAYLQLKFAGMSDEYFKTLDRERNSATMHILFKNSETILYLVRELDINFSEMHTETKLKLYERFSKSLSNTSRLYKLYLELMMHFIKSEKFESAAKCLSYVANCTLSGVMELSRMIEIASMIQFSKEVAKVPMKLKEIAYNQIMGSILARYKHIEIATEETKLGLAHLLTAYNPMPRAERLHKALTLIASALPHLKSSQQLQAIQDIFGFMTMLINERCAINPNEDGRLINQFDETEKTIQTVAGQYDLAIYIANELQKMVTLTENPEAEKKYFTLAGEWFSIASLLVKAVELEKRATLLATAKIEQETNAAIRQQVTERKEADQVALNAYRDLRRRGVPIFNAVEQVRASSTMVRSLDDEHTSVTAVPLKKN